MLLIELASTDRSRWRGAPLDARAAAMTCLWVITKDLRRVIELINAALQYVKDYGAAQGLLAIIESGGGKTALCSALQRAMPDEHTDEQTYLRIAVMKVPAVCADGNLYEELLRALGDPEPEAGSAKKKRNRAAQLLKKCGLLILAVDNFQDIPEHRPKKGVRSVGNWFRKLMDEHPIVFLAVGTEAAKEVRLANFQVRRRYMTQVHVPYFSFETVAGRVAWVQLLEDIDAALPLAESSGLSSARLRGRLFVACNGVIDYLIQLLRRALTIAVRKGQEFIAQSDLEEAYRRLHGTVDEVANPFVETFKHRLLTEEDEPFYDPARGKVDPETDMPALAQAS